MTRSTLHARIADFPWARSFQGARLETLSVESRGQRLDLIIDYQEFKPNTQELLQRNEKIIVHLQGSIIPRRLRFRDVRRLEITGAYGDPAILASDHPARELRDMLCWVIPGETRPFYLLFNNSPDEKDGLRFFAGDAIAEARAEPEVPFDLERHWLSPPPFRPGLIPAPKSLYRSFGGDPITIHMGSAAYHRRLFIGGIETQSEQRPRVSSVLNLGERPSKWAQDDVLPESDRWEKKGEGYQGMTLEDIRQEANWVIEQLRGGRVLVHCVGGMNRSSTICCAVLILWEGLSAEAALSRVREHHPWARPDSNHWLKLLWLAETNSGC